MTCGWSPGRPARRNARFPVVSLHRRCGAVRAPGNGYCRASGAPQCPGRRAAGWPHALGSRRRLQLAEQHGRTLRLCEPPAAHFPGDIATQEHAGEESLQRVDGRRRIALRMQHQSGPIGPAAPSLETGGCTERTIDLRRTVHDPFAGVRRKLFRRHLPPRSIPPAGKRIALAKWVENCRIIGIHPWTLAAGGRREQSLPWRPAQDGASPADDPAPRDMSGADSARQNGSAKGRSGWTIGHGPTLCALARRMPRRGHARKDNGVEKRYRPDCRRTARRATRADATAYNFAIIPQADRNRP